MITRRHGPLLIAGLLVGLCASLATAAPELAVPRLATPPTIDGRLDDSCWQVAPPITEFRCVDKERSVPTQRTEAWVAADADAFYVAARCFDDHMEEVPTDVTERDGPVWQDDCLEVFLMPGTPYVYHFAANLPGARFDARYGGPAAPATKPPAWDGEWRVAARREATCWTMEIAIPWGNLEWGAARVGAPCRFNLGREQRRLTEFSCWPASEFNKSDEFATLTGLTIDAQRYGLRLADVATEPVTPGANRYTATVAEEPAPGALTLRARVQALPGGPEQTFSASTRSAPGAPLALDYAVPLGGGRVTAVFECLDTAGKVRVSQSALWRVPAPLEAALDLPLVYVSDGAIRLAGRVALRGTAKLEVVLAGDAKPSASVPAAIGADGRFAVRLPLGGLKPGRYEIQTRLTPRGATAPVVNQFPFRLIAGPLD